MSTIYNTPANLTNVACPFCSQEFNQSLHNTNKVVELACKHFYHTQCLNQQNRTRCRRPIQAMRCLVCGTPYTKVPHKSCKRAFNDQDDFNDLLTRFQKEYQDDDDALQLLSKISQLRNDASDMVGDHPNRQKDPHRQKDGRLKKNPYPVFRQTTLLVRNDPKLSRALECIAQNWGSLRTAREETIRWSVVPFDKFPELLKEQGVVAGDRHDQMRMSVGHLYRSIQTMWDNELDPAKIAFGRAAWAKFGNVGKIPPISNKIKAILRQQSYWHPLFLTGHTDHLMLMPEAITVKGTRRLLTVSVLRELITNLQDKDTPQFVNCAPSVQQAFGDTKVPGSYWAIISKEIVPGSHRVTSYKKQKKLVQELGREDYELPSIREAAISAFLYQHKETNKDPQISPRFWTYTACKETIQTEGVEGDKGQDPVVVKSYDSVGNFLQGCISTKSLFGAPARKLDTAGVVAVRKFPGLASE